MAPVVIIGGGISGLATAYYLRKAGVASTIVEPRERLGGVIQTERVEGCLIEAGPDSFLSAKPWAEELIRELGLGSEIIGSNDHLRKTYIRRNGSMVPIPDGLQMMVPTRVLPMLTTPLVSWRTKVKMGAEWFRRPSAGPDRSVADFVRDHYGDEAVDYLAEPLLAGVYGGDPEELSVESVLPRFVEIERRYGSLTKGTLSAMGARSGGTLFRTLKGGLSTLVDALSKDALWLRCAAESVEPNRVRVNGHWVEAGAIVLACEAHQAARLLPDAMIDIPYGSAITIGLVYRQTDVASPPDGFGFLIPRKERRRLVACTFVGTKFSDRVPEDKLLMRCFLGDAAMGERDEVLTAAAREELREFIGLDAEPVAARIFRWPRSMAQYTVGHLARLQQLEVRMRQWPSIHLVGNAYRGIGIPDCVRLAKETAERIAAQLAR